MKVNPGFQLLTTTLLIGNMNLWTWESFAQTPPQLKDQEIQKLTLQHMPTESDAFAPTSWVEAEEVVMQGLDKITARVFTVTAKINQLVKFGTLDIYVRKGYKAPPEETPESVCFLEISERKSGEAPKLVFSGWMFASNPSLYPLEHPVYDVWVKEVKTPHQAPTSAFTGSDNKIQKDNKDSDTDQLSSPDLIEDGF
jgi:hypothetical protein